MVKYIVAFFVVLAFMLADIYIFAICGAVIGFGMIALEAVAVLRLRYELTHFN